MCYPDGNNMGSLKKLFMNKQFVHYSWIAVAISLLNIFLLWVLIDLVHLHTVLAGFVVMIITFFSRFLLYSITRVL